MEYVDDGDIVTVQGTFRKSDGTLEDPDAVFVNYRFGNDSIVTKQFGVDSELTKPSTGVYAIRLDTTGQQGQFCHYRFYSTGNGQAAEEGVFYIRRSQVIP